MGTNFYWLDDREGSVVEGVHPSAPATGPSRGPSRSGARAPVGSDSVAPTAPQGGPDTAALLDRARRVLGSEAPTNDALIDAANVFTWVGDEAAARLALMRAGRE